MTLTDSFPRRVDQDGGATPFAGRLVQKARLLLRHGEVLATAALAAMLEEEPLRAAFESALGIEPDDAAHWLTERPLMEGERRGRVDLVREDTAGRWQVIVEAKLAHRMSADQLELYASPADAGRVLLLVPAYRRTAAQRILDTSRLAADSIRDVITWEEIIETFQAERRTPAIASDVDQFTALVQALSKPIIEPFGDASPQELLTQRLDDLTELVNHVTVALQERFVPGKRILTLDDRGRDAPFAVRRYVEVVPGGTHLAIGVVGLEPEVAILWVRYHSRTFQFRALDRTAVSPQRPQRDWGGHLWLGLPIPTSPDLGEMVDVLCSHVDDIHQQLTGGESYG